MAFGQILRSAREQRGLSHSAVAQATYLKVQIVEDLENEDFKRIAAPIYGRGFIRLYAGFLQIDHEPLVRDFMELYSGERPPAVRTSVLSPVKQESGEVAPKVAPATLKSDEEGSKHQQGVPRIELRPEVSEASEVESAPVQMERVGEVVEVSDMPLVDSDAAGVEAAVDKKGEPSDTLLESEVEELITAEPIVAEPIVVEAVIEEPLFEEVVAQEPVVEKERTRERQTPIFRIGGSSEVLEHSGGGRFRSAMSDAGYWLRERWADLCDLVLRGWDALPHSNLASWRNRALGVALVAALVLMLVGITKLFKMTSQGGSVATAQQVVPGRLDSVGPPQDMFVD